MTFAKEKARKNVCEKFLIEITVFELKRSGISYLFWTRWFLFAFRRLFTYKKLSQATIIANKASLEIKAVKETNKIHHLQNPY